MKPLLAAIQFLTVCPFPSRFVCGKKELERSVVYFPAIGLLIGVALVLLDCGLRWLLPVLPASVLVVIAMIAVSGGFHMDGLADTADGLMSARSRERMLEIMKDSRSGPMGVMAIVCMILLKVSLLASVAGPLRLPVILLMPLAGRCALIFEMCLLKYARREGGLAAVFGSRKPLAAAVVAILVLVVTSFAVLGTIGLIAAACSVLTTIIFSIWCRGKIGGFTGDTLGAACEIAELAPVLVAASWRWGL